MSTGPNETDRDDPNLPVVDDDVTSTGAAADSAETDERLQALPRILRYAMLVSDSGAYVWQRLVAEIDELCPHLPLNAAWAKSRDAGLGVALGIELDHRAVKQDQPDLRSLADCVRLLSLPVPRDSAYLDDHRRVAKALLQALGNLRRGTDAALLADLEAFSFGWAALPAGTDLLPKMIVPTAASGAKRLGGQMAKHRIAAAEGAVWQQMEEREARAQRAAGKAKADQASKTEPASDAVAVPDNHVVVARLSDEQMKNVKLKEIIGPLKNVINVALPLVMVPPLHQVRDRLMFEFPYAINVIDFALADLVGRITVRLRPLLLVGDPGGGKSRFARRLGEVLGLNVWRTDASRSDGAVFAGTDRRWYSAEPCHSFLAIGQARHANPMVLLDEIEKAGTRSDYGRLWDCLLGFLEPETNARYADPALQVTIDLSHISYVATANTLDPLPSPVRDRFRVISFPKPTKDDLDALLPAVIADLTAERSLDRRWIEPLDGLEHDAVAIHWRGGSVRRLRRVVEAVLRERDLRAARN
jgi:ATP-dependent Lon protease